MLQGVDARALMKAPMTVFFASRQCPGAAIRAAMDWALAQAKVRIGCLTHLQSGSTVPVKYWIEILDSALSHSQHTPC